MYIYTLSIILDTLYTFVGGVLISVYNQECIKKPTAAELMSLDMYTAIWKILYKVLMEPAQKFTPA